MNKKFKNLNEAIKGIMEKITSWRAFEVVLSILMTICLGLAAWSLKQAHETSVQIATITENQVATSKSLSRIVEIVDRHEVSLATITANRFTSSDGLNIWKEIAAIRENLAKLPTEGFTAIPGRITSLEQSRVFNEQRLAKLEDDLQNGRKERLIFQGEAKAEFSKLEANNIRVEEKLDGLRTLLERLIPSGK